MSLIKTKPLCILTSGQTVDGREVTEQTLQEMVETYDPKTYNARINIDHSGYGPKLGSVFSLSLKDAKINEKDCKQLFAELSPNDYFLYLIQQGQKVHSSAEIKFNFAKTGKAYLTGLALTDNPASLGTDEIKLAAENNYYSTNEIIEFKPKKPTLIQNFFNKEEEDMNEKMLLEMAKQFKEALAKNTEAMNAMLASKETASCEKPPATETAELKTAIEKLTAENKQTMDELVELKANLAKQTDEPPRQKATGSDESDNEVL